MAHRKPKIPEGEFFVMGPARPEQLFGHRGLSDKLWRDPDPSVSATIWAKRDAHYRLHYPALLADKAARGITTSDLCHIVSEDLPPRMTRDTIHSRIIYRGNTHKHLSHCSVARDFSSQHEDYYRHVSKEWRDAVQQFEPDVHEFWPFSIEFEDGVTDRFIFRNLSVFNFFDRTRLITFFHINAAFPSKLVVLRHKVAGKHLFRHENTGYTFISRALALRFSAFMTAAELLPLHAVELTD